MKKGQWKTVNISAALHFLVDGLCICCLYTLAYPFSIPHLAAVFMTYNVLAFLTQPLTGALADKTKGGIWMLWTAVALLSMAVLVASITTISNASQPSWTLLLTIASLLGMGNSLFHVWGGRQTAVSTDNDIRALGVFVSTGAFGLSVGILLYSWILLCVMQVLLIVLAGAATMVVQEQRLRVGMGAKTTGRRALLGNGDERQGFSIMTPVFILLLMAFVMLRSFVGETFTAGMERTGLIVLLIGLFAMLGKMAGGWIAKGMGIWCGATLMVMLTVICLLLQQVGLSVRFTGLLMVNCTMPVTLYLANVVLKDHEGLAFGLLAAALMPGYLMVML